MIPIRHAISRSYRLTAALTSTVSDDGGAGRTPTIGTVGQWVRPVLARPAWTGGSGIEPSELLGLVGTALTAGAGGGTWAVSLHTDGRTKVTWTGTGTGSISAGTVLQALGFTGGTGTLSPGQSAYSQYPAPGLVLWPFAEDDSGWAPESDSAATRDGAGRSYVYRSAYVRWKRSFVARWVPKEWSHNAAGEYFTPAWSGLVSSVQAPPNVSPSAWSWLHAVLGVRDSVPWGHVDDILAITRLDTVFLAPSMYTDSVFEVMDAAKTYDARRQLRVELILSMSSVFP